MTPEEAIEQVRALADRWSSLPCVSGYRIPNDADDDSQCLRCAADDLRAVLASVDAPAIDGCLWFCDEEDQ